LGQLLKLGQNDLNMVKRINTAMRRSEKLSLKTAMIWMGVGLMAGSVSLSTARAEPEAAKAAETAKAEAAPSPSPEEVKFVQTLHQISDLFGERRFLDAEQLLEEAEKMKPNDPNLAMIRAGIYAETGHYDQAREIYDKALAKDPEGFVPNFNLVELLMMQKQYTKAREGFETMLKNFPDNDFLYFKILLTCLAENNQVDALQWYQKLQRQEPTPIMNYAAAAIAIRSGDLPAGKQLMLDAEARFGAGQHRLLYQSLAGIDLVLATDYPPKAPAPAPAPEATPAH